MRKLFCFLLLICLFLGGCKNVQATTEGMILRQKLSDSNGCTFDAIIVADYSDKIFEFELSCQYDDAGKLCFEVENPESISGITGFIDGQGGNLTFDESILAFSPLADGYLTPVSVPWIMMKALSGGYISALSHMKEGNVLYIDDSYNAQTFHLEITLDSYGSPCFCEIIWENRRILSMKINNFTFL